MSWLIKAPWISADKHSGDIRLDTPSQSPSGPMSLSSLLDSSSHSSSDGSKHIKLTDYGEPLTHTHHEKGISVHSSYNTISILMLMSQEIMLMQSARGEGCYPCPQRSPSEQHMLTMISKDVCWAISKAVASLSSSFSLWTKTGNRISQPTETLITITQISAASDKEQVQISRNITSGKSSCLRQAWGGGAQSVRRERDGSISPRSAPETVTWWQPKTEPELNLGGCPDVGPPNPPVCLVCRSGSRSSESPRTLFTNIKIHI